MLCIDASRFGHPQPTGVEVYSNYLIPLLIQRAEKEHQIIEIVAPTQKNIQSRYVRSLVVSGKRLWTYFHLSLFMWKRRGDITTLFVPSHVLPLILPKWSVVTIHDVAWKRIPDSYSFMQRMLLELGTRLAVKRASTIICISESTQRDLERFYQCPRSKTRLIPLGFDKQAFCSSFVVRNHSFLSKYGVETEKYFIYIGRVEEKKNIAHLIRSFLATPDTGWKLVLVGKPGVGFPLIAELLETYEAQRRIIHTGYLSADDAYSLLAYAGAFVFPSRFEGFGIPVLEAQALDVPVLCSAAGALPEVAGDAALYLDNTEAGVSRLLQEFMEGYIDKQTLIERGRENLKRFSWERCADEVWETLP